MSQAENQLTPEGWSNTNIGDFAPLQRGFDLPNRDRINGIYPVVYSNGVMNFHNTYQVKGPGVITGRSGTIGKVHYVNDDYWPHNTALWVKQFNNAIPKYVYYLYTYIGFDRFSSGSGVPTLNRNDAHSFAITVPTKKEEQTAIANALSDVDALLTELEKLIAKKQAIKTASMQQLLTGKTRLPQFTTYSEGEKQGQPKGTKSSELGEIPDDWEVLILSELCDVRDGTHDSPKYQDNGVPLVTSKNIVNDTLDLSNVSLISDNDALEIDKRSKVHKGDIIMSMIGTVGSAVLLNDAPEFCIKNVALFKPKKVMGSFLIQLIRSKYFQEALKDSIDGGIQKFVSLGTLRAMSITLPPEKEQRALAIIFTDMDNEIQTLEQRLTKTRQIKQGMMQQLLTGRTRLPF